MQYAYVNGLKISALTLGTSQLGLEYGIANKTGKPDLKKCFDILDTSVNGGINTFDTAMAYGDAEDILGRYFYGRDSTCNNTTLITKLYVEEKENVSAKQVERNIYACIEQSLSRLKINKIPVCLLHEAKDMTAFGSVVPDTFRKIINEGLIGKAGVSVYYGREIDQALENDLYEVVQIPINIMDQRLIKSGHLKKLRDKNIIVFARSIFLKGLFFLKQEELKGNLKAAEEPLKSLNELAANEGLSTAQLALAYIRDMEGITSLVIGAETPEQVMDNIKLMETPPISEKTRQTVGKLFENVSEIILNPMLWKV